MSFLQEKNNKLMLYTPYEDLSLVKEIPISKKWNRKEKSWEFPLTVENFNQIKEKIIGLKIDESLNQTLVQLEEVNKDELNFLKDLKKKDYVFPFKPKLKPYQHQVVMSNFIRNFKCGAILSEMGTGKTKSLIDGITWLIKENQLNPKKVLVVVPKSILENWEEEIKINSNLSSIILIGKKEKRIKYLEEDVIFYIINYEGIKVMFDELFEKEWGMIVLDESTKIKSRKAQVTKALYKLRDKTKRRIIMTGAIITEKPFDIFSQFKFLKSEVFGTTFMLFRDQYAVMGGYGGYEVLQWKNLDKLKEKVFRYGIRFSKEECLDLPPKIFTKELFDFTDKQKEVYKKLKRDFIAELKGETIITPTIMSRIMKFSEVSSGFLIKQDEKTLEKKIITFDDNPKLKLLEDIIERNNEKTVIWTRFRWEVELLEKYFKNEKINYSVIHGDIKNRQEQIENFNTRNRFIICQIKIGSLGINLQAASIAIFFSLPYSYGDYIQAIDRCHRIGLKHKVLYIVLLAKNSIDIHIHKILQDKKNLVDYLMKEPEEIKNIL